MKGVFARIRRLCIGAVVVFLICGTVCVLAMENITQDTLPPGYYDTKEFFSWLESETDLKAFLETDRIIDGAFAEGYARRLKEFYEQDSRSFISTLAECSADAQYRAVCSLPYGYIGLQELEPFYDELLLFMAEDTWNEQETEVMRQLKSRAEHQLDMMLPELTTEPLATEVTVPEETAPDIMGQSLYSDEKQDSSSVWYVIIIVILTATLFAVYIAVKAKKN